ncbi:MAG TPA: glutamine-hydrolyzing GMP synthase [Candidatus Dormibacteraeota bacterium]|nr:glutamine-hydrolyzing GMP synthase [Candidatus Dormibacteraeota bacterium]
MPRVETTEEPGTVEPGQQQPGTAPAGRETVLVLDFGSQYSQLIARRVREAKVYCELIPGTAPIERIRELQPRGLIFSGGPASVYENGAPHPDRGLYDLGVPILGICYGMQLMAEALGGTVEASNKREYGLASLVVDDKQSIFGRMPDQMPVWMSHGDVISDAPPGFRVLAHSGNSPVAAMGDDRGRLAIQFHPEVVHTPLGKEIIHNFLYDVCGCTGNWEPLSFIESAVAQIRAQVGNGRVICALSGGVDSAVAATLVHRAIGDQLTCVFVNNGLLRLQEGERVIDVMTKELKIDLRYVDATDRFLTALAGVSDPEAKRKIIGREFINVFADEARAIGLPTGGRRADNSGETPPQKVAFLAQGTLYPDVIESTSHDTNHAHKIKSHHNVGGLPDDLDFKLVEPLRYLFKDEVRQVGLALGLPGDMVFRQPFPGPGLAIRVIGEVTRDRLDTLREADWIVIDEIKKAGLYRQVWQSFAILTPISSVGVMGDLRTYANVVAVRVVTSDDGMTADWAKLPYDVLGAISSRIVNEVAGVNRVVYDVSSKPPSTIEWE